jgi:hypothetical protein
MRAMRRLVLLLVLLLGGGRLAADEEPEAPPAAEAEERAPKDAEDAKAKLEVWIRELGSDRFEVRERARKAVVRWGDMARDVLLAHREDPDPEVRQAVRAALEKDPTPEAETPKPAEDLSTIGLVTLTARGPVGDAFDALARPRGARFVLPEGAGGAHVDLEATAEPFFGVLARVAAAAGLDAGGTFDASSTLALSREATAGPAWTAAGPLRTRPVRIARTRTLAKEGDRTYSLTLTVQWMPGVELVSYKPPKVLRAEDPAGRAYRGPGGEGNVTFGVGPSTTAVDVTTTLLPSVPEAEEHLAALDLAVTARVRHGLRSVRFDAAAELPVTLDAAGVPAKEGADGTLTLRSLVRPKAEREPLTMELTARFGGETPARSARAHLETADGTRVPLQVTGRNTSADGVTRVTARVYGSSASVVPVTLVVSWFERETDGQVEVHLADVPLR